MTGTKPDANQFGLHYFPDTLHYRQTDLRAWLPEFHALGVAWLVLEAPGDRAIPEDFISGLCNAGIQPVLHFKQSPAQLANSEEMAAIFDAYRRWGVKYITLFDCPNSRQAWPATAWAQTDLVERFLARFIPLAESVVSMDMQPVFAPLEPGGDYWDTAFLRAALQYLQKLRKAAIVDKLVLGAYAAAGERPLDWGMGGPERWPGARPYYTPEGEQDQRGCCISDWYRAISKAVLGRSLPMMLFGAGSPGWTPNPAISRNKSQADVERNITLVSQYHGFSASTQDDTTFEDILACHFWLLSAASDDPQAGAGWYDADGQTSALVGVLKQRNAQGARSTDYSFENCADFEKKRSSGSDAVAVETIAAVDNSIDSAPVTASRIASERHPISHYLLLPKTKDGLFDIKIDGIYSFIKKFNITVGFSLDEAALASQVTILETDDDLPAHDLEYLRSMGSKVVCIRGSGTELAQFLSAF